MVAMASTAPALARCPFKACPVRYRGGSDRPCAEHDDSNATRFAASELGIDLGGLRDLAEQTPGQRDDSNGNRDGNGDGGRRADSRP
jgi:hypothetical protein